MLVLEEVAASRDVDPLALPPLFETIDPAVVDAVVQADTEATLTFAYAGRDVSVGSDGEIDVSPRE